MIGMKGSFVNLRNFLNAKCPELSGNISGELYPPPEFNKLIASLTSYLWMGGLALIFAGDTIFQSIGIPEPQFYQYIKQNKVGAGFALFMVIFNYSFFFK